MHLNLSSCSFVNDCAIKAIASHCLCLQELILQSCRSSDLTRTGFNYISLIQNLTYLDLYRTLIDDSSIFSIIKSCSKLEHLFLGSCIGIKDFNEVAQAIGRNLKNLKTLDLWRATSLNCAGVKEIAEHCNDLIELDLGWCYLIEASCGCIRQLLSNCTKVKKLGLSAIRSISNNDVDIIACKCKAIEQLDILGLSEVTVDAVRTLLQSCKMLKLLDVSYCNTSVKSA
ncbi:F-box/LRR-repeat protein 4, partial [Stegodyphus mimosarum]